MNRIPGSMLNSFGMNNLLLNGLLRCSQEAPFLVSASPAIDANVLAL
ncbi:hypothetical protein LINGRAHAP2_LOCUS35262, partial [Linum grandiflorum]